MDNLIFVGGIHGVGKTYFCNTVSHKYNIASYSASELISRQRREPLSTDKKVGNISVNQNILLKSLLGLKIGTKWFMLDGHFCLINSQGKVDRVPETTFQCLLPKGIIVVVDSAEKIHERLRVRDGIAFSIDFIRQFQNEELMYSREIATTLSVPYRVHNSNESVDTIRGFLEDLIY